MDDIQQFDKFTATLRVRRGGGWNARPTMEPFEGKPITVQASWIAEAPSIYAGEWCMEVLSEGFPVPWVASGDLSNLRPTGTTHPR